MSVTDAAVCCACAQVCVTVTQIKTIPCVLGVVNQKTGALANIVVAVQLLTLPMALAGQPTTCAVPTWVRLVRAVIRRNRAWSAIARQTNSNQTTGVVVCGAPQDTTIQLRQVLAALLLLIVDLHPVTPIMAATPHHLRKDASVGHIEQGDIND